ncbi:hypothetical protein PR202_gb12078 [Eleusine coracana subsp. coracana]|uniref:F-box domain-containing protein n=1 Tax=Eleusine coracana subsp. coracana TaxID=191504 RepID=A0AAV5EP39_ELECO|nr:hypothetical protein PR202_gb12078 [Eleusine coracana subsp. coracana]
MDAACTLAPPARDTPQPVKQISLYHCASAVAAGGVRRSSMPPPELLEENYEEILLRFPPDDPACLFRAALACKRWCRLISSARFRRRFRECHRSPPLLGAIRCQGTGTRFWPASAAKELALRRRPRRLLRD